MIQPKNTRCTTCQTINPADATFCWICKSHQLRPMEEFTTEPNPQMAEGGEKSYHTSDKTTVKPGLFMFRQSEDAELQEQPRPSLFGSNDTNLSYPVSHEQSNGCAAVMFLLMLTLCLLPIALFVSFLQSCGAMLGGL